MHLRNPLHRITLVLVLYIGIFHGVLNAEVEEPDPETLAKKGMVFVEPKDFISEIREGQSSLLPYRDRRHTWGALIGVNYNSYAPTNYTPNFSPADYKSTYGTTSSPMIEGVITVKRNFAGGSFGGEIGVGQFTNISNHKFVESTLSITLLRVGVVYILDTLRPNPYLAPYFSGGLYALSFNEKLGGNKFGGTTAPAAYATGGIAFLLDWIDPKAARIGFEQSNVKATFLYVEGRKYFVSNASKDRDFGSPFAWAAGVRVEF